ncbi:LETM1 and EF-hand domain-containing protein 1, mitochondrial [Canna indica]|uniref:Mitochondrial proton/calcium exchanger protein n=1 Tax=Canna indica TaxID=4628 RepID=A0AAQ3JQN8_9LILI|nr:LETM1 and EF-hand domain-containing protein 1, mitochondrial [Canna indica]
MTSQAMIRGKKNLLKHLSTPVRAFSSFSRFGHETDTGVLHQVLKENPCEAEGSERRCNGLIIAKEDLVGFYSPKYVERPHGGIFISGLRYGRQEFVLPFAVRGFAQSSRTVSTATAGQPEMQNDDQPKDQSQKQFKEASPEECDQAVEELSTAKAKAKDKQVQDSSKTAQSFIQKFWAKLLGIVPAIRAVASMSRADWAVKLRHWKDEFVSTLQHYWLGLKLLWADVRISSRLLQKLAVGKSLTRRERQQLTRTTADIFRLVPVAVFIIVPFMEFLLPVFLKLFPNMLPSTFQDKMKEQEALKRRLKAKIEYAKFLQDTVKEMAKEVQTSHSGEIKQTAEDLDEFLNKVRTGASVSNDEIMSFAKLFNDELTLDNMSRPRLINMCKYMGIPPFGTDNYLRFMLRRKLQEIKEDDKLIQAEGVESLSEEELRQACRERGHLGLLSTEEMRQQLRDWLDLSLNRAMPSSLLILSRAFTISGKLKPEEAVVATLSSLPDEVVDTVGTVLPSEDSVSERRRKLEFLEMQEELIKEEEKKQVKEEEKVKMKESEIIHEDTALKEMTGPTAREAEELARAKTLEKQEQLCKISRALAVLASASSVTTERKDFLSLVNKEIELYNTMLKKEGTDGEEEAKKAYRAARKESDDTAAADKVSSALIDRVDAMLQELEKEIDDVDAKIGDRWKLLDRDHDGKVTPEEVAAAATYLKDTLGKEGVEELISNLSRDRGHMPSKSFFCSLSTTTVLSANSAIFVQQKGKFSSKIL